MFGGALVKIEPVPPAGSVININSWSPPMKALMALTQALRVMNQQADRQARQLMQVSLLTPNSSNSVDRG